MLAGTALHARASLLSTQAALARTRLVHAGTAQVIGREIAKTHLEFSHMRSAVATKIIQGTRKIMTGTTRTPRDEEQ
ncbi:hypothetical protein JRQ81_004642 [Phrynocephalus forsythii]|uniref:Uncharacterized protein n=1 Tax=Phrynocephalus forsythii TaxID=171643 RepID=A0A9Q1AV20_9SAUR|nr:hypothetical protein JRQ81_004642 [Phrynocephalus forsythii]